MLPKKTLFSAVSVMGILLFGQACSPPPNNEFSQSDLPSLQMLLAGDYIGMTSRGEIYHSIVKLQVPEFGGDIFYHHISLESLGGAAEQQKIYAFNDSGTHMRSTVLLGRGEIFVDEQTMARKLDELTEDDLLRFPDDCQFQWKTAADGFVAEVRRERCSYESPAFGGVVSPEMKYILSRCTLAISEGIFREDDSPVFPPSTVTNRRLNPKTDECSESRH